MRYTPVIDVLNDAGIATASGDFRWSEDDGIVSVFGVFTFDWGGINPGPTSVTQLGISLPVPVNPFNDNTFATGHVLEQGSEDVPSTRVVGIVNPEEGGTRVITVLTTDHPFQIGVYRLQFAYEASEMAMASVLRSLGVTRFLQSFGR